MTKPRVRAGSATKLAEKSTEKSVGKSQSQSSATSTATKSVLILRVLVIGLSLFISIVLLAAVFWPLPDDASPVEAEPLVASDSAAVDRQVDEREWKAELPQARQWLLQPPPTQTASIDFDGVQSELRSNIEQMLESYPEDYRVFHLAGLVYTQLKQSTLAEQALRNSLQRNAGELQVRIDLAKLLMQTGRDEEALKILEPGAEAGHRLPTYSLVVAELQNRLGNLDEAWAILHRALKNFPDSPETLLQMGMVQFQRGDLEAAQSHLRGSLELDRERELTWLTLCQVLSALKSTAALADAQKELERVRRQTLARQRLFEEVHLSTLRRFAVSSHRSMAVLYLEHRQSEKAKLAFERALQLDPGDLLTLNGFVAFHRRSGDLAAACELNRRIVAVQPDQYVNYTNLAALCLEAGHPARAEATLQLAAERGLTHSTNAPTSVKSPSVSPQP